MSTVPDLLVSRGMGPPEDTSRGMGPPEETRRGMAVVGARGSCGLRVLCEDDICCHRSGARELRSSRSKAA